MKAVSTSQLTRKFGPITAVEGVDLEIEEGEIFGLLGPNGAGKTTLTKLLATLLLPTSGKAWVWGYDVEAKPHEARKLIGIVFQDPSIDEKLTGREHLELHAHLYGMRNGPQRRERIRLVLELVGLADRADSLLETYSGGMQRRLEIARGLLHRPRVLFLDEPTLGLDAQTRRLIWDYIKELNRKEGMTVMLMTHYMEEADYLCDRVAIMDQGRIVALDTPENLKRRVGADVIRLKTSEADKLAEILHETKWIKRVEQKDSNLMLWVEDGESKLPQVAGLAWERGINVKSMNLEKPSLEDVFLKLTGRRIREEEGDSTEYLRRIIRARRRR